jgi:hypothetical protein
MCGTAKQEGFPCGDGSSRGALGCPPRADGTKQDDGTRLSVGHEAGPQRSAARVEHHRCAPEAHERGLGGVLGHVFCPALPQRHREHAAAMTLVGLGQALELTTGDGEHEITVGRFDERADVARNRLYSWGTSSE